MAAIAGGTLISSEEAPAPAARKESVSSRLVAGVIVVASLSVVGVGAWALHGSPPPKIAHPTTVATKPDAAVRYQSTSVTGDTPYRLDVAVGAADPVVSAGGVVSKYSTVRELDVVHLPASGTGPADLTAMLSTFAAGWPTAHVTPTTAAAGPAVGFDLTNDTAYTHGVLVDGGAAGVFLIAVKSPVGSSIGTVDQAVLRRGVDSLHIGA